MERLNILIVDDDPSFANFIKLKIKQEASNFSIAAVESGQDCLEYLKRHTVDCILSDYQMPGMSGMELLQTLRAQGNDVPFIFITGQGNENVAREAFTGGAADYFTKDWGFAHFAKIVNSVENAVRHGRVERSHMECEQALHQSEERYRAFIANSSEGILRYEGDMPISISLPEDEQIEQIFRHSYLAECNDAGARMYGFDNAAEMAGARLSDVLVRSDPRNTELIRAFIRSGYRLVNSVSYNNDRNGNIHCIMNSFIGTVENGHLVRAWGVDRDITELKKMEEALRKSEERYRSFVANSSEAIWCFELEQPIPVSSPEARQIEMICKYAYLAECNDAGAHMLGLAHGEDAAGMMHDDIVPSDDPRNVEHLRRFIRSGYRLANDETFIRDKKGNMRQIYSTLNGVVEDGRLLRAWGVSNTRLCPI